MSRLTKRIIFIGAMILISLFGLAIGLRSGSASVVGKPAPSPRFLQAAGQCPPSTTIHGTLGSGSPDYPATSGQQTGRIVNGLGNVTCGSSNPCTLNTTTGSRAFDAYTFTNTGAAACVSVTFTMSGCSLGQAMQFSARLGSFDPANPCANYIADGGAGFSGEFTGANSKTFSFNVAAGQDFVVVVNENDPATSVGCGYTLTISGLACQAAPCPPTTPINGTVGSGSPDFPATSGQQTGRILNGLGNIACGSSNPCSLNTTTGSRAFDAYTFNNSGSTTACVTVAFTMTGCVIGQSLQFSARLGSFDPANPCANYVADGGAGFSGLSNSSFSFNVPAGQNFVVVVNENDPAGAVGCAYSLTISGLSCVPSCPGITCPANIVVSNTQGQCGAIVNYTTPTAQASCGTVSCSPGSGSFFPLGTTSVTCNTTSGSSCSFTVTVQDTQPPSITCPANVTVNNSPGQCSAAVNYPSPSASDNCGVVGLTCSPQSGSTFAVGTTTVNCTATDASGSTASCSFTVRVNDTQPPTITCPANITAVATGACPAALSKAVSFPAPTASDNCPGVSVVCSPPSGSTFPLGTTTVTCTATDGAGNPATCAFTVTVFDVCLQDDSNPSTVLLINSTTGDYRFCCGGTTVSGRGTVIVRGCTITLQHNPGDRRVTASIDNSVFRGSASLQSPPGTIKCTIADRDTRNNSCACQ